MLWLKQSTAVTIPLGPFVDSADGNTAETSLTIAQADIRLSKNGGTYAQSNNAAGATHLEGGEYGVPLNTTDTNTLGRLKLRVHVAGALPVWLEFMVVPANRYDALVLGTDLLDVEAAAMAADVITTAAIADGALTGAKLADGLLSAAKFAAGAFDAVWSVAARLLTAGTNIVLAKGTGVTGFNDLSAAAVNAEVDTALADAGVSAAVMANLDAAVSSRSTLTEAQANAQADQALVDAGVTSAVMARLDATVSSRSTVTEAQVNAQADQALVDAGVTPTVMGRLDAAVSTRATPANVTDATAPLATTAGLSTVNTNVLARATPADVAGAVAPLATTADLVTVNNNVLARATPADVAAAVDDLATEATLDAVGAIAAAVQAKTDALPAAPAAVGDIPTAVANADALLGRSIAGGANGGRTVTSALRRIRNRVRSAAGVLSIYREDDTTVDHTAAVTTAPGDPITEVDPA